MNDGRLVAMRRSLQQWWAGVVPASARQPDPIRTTAVGGYGQALTFYVLTLGAFAVTAVLNGAAAWGFHPAWSVVGYRWLPLALWGTLAVLTLWYAVLMRCRLIWAWAVGVVALVVADAVLTGGAMRTPDGLYDVAAATMGALVAFSLARQRGLSLTGFGFGHGHCRQDHHGRRETFVVFWWAVAASTLSTLVGIAIIVLGLPYGHSPIRAHEHPAGVIVRMLGAGVTEEVMVAVVVIALSAARRRVWEMYALSEVIRVSYHMYYQAVGPSVLVMGAVNLWLYRRTRRLAPIICAHFLTDVMSYTTSFGTLAKVITVAVELLLLQLVTKLWLKTPATDDHASTPRSSVEEPVQ